MATTRHTQHTATPTTPSRRDGFHIDEISCTFRQFCTTTSPHYGIDGYHHTPITRCAAAPIPLPPLPSEQGDSTFTRPHVCLILTTSLSLRWHRRPLPHPNDTIHSRSHHPLLSQLEGFYVEETFYTSCQHLDGIDSQHTPTT